MIKIKTNIAETFRKHCRNLHNMNHKYLLRAIIILVLINKIKYILNNHNIFRKLKVKFKYVLESKYGDNK